MTAIHARTALTETGWQADLRVILDHDGRIAAVTPAVPAEEGDRSVDILLPAPGNLHSHAFQRAMAGLSEYRTGAADSFWTWRELMYRFLERLTPEHVAAIAAEVQVEMLEAGYAAVGEFHYVHHRPDGRPYDDPAELSHRIAAAAAETGIGLTHLPVLYARGGPDGRALSGGQRRFGTDLEGFARLVEAVRAGLAALPGDTRLGVAPHSLRAVAPEDLVAVAGLVPDGPVHMHIAEQVGEVEAIEAAYGTPPVAWALSSLEIDARWCLIHATHMTAQETEALAARGAVVGLCPITEANLGDGIFDGARYLAAGGRFGVGSDSNLRIGLAEELRQLEHSQRLRDRARAVLCDAERSVGRVLYEGACRGAAQALGREAGAIAPGRLADLVALDGDALVLDGLAGDRILDAWIFAGDDRLVSEVWSAGRHLVEGGRHPRREAVAARFRAALTDLREAG